MPPGTPSALKRVPIREFYEGEGVRGVECFAFQNKPGHVKLLVQRMRQNGWSADEAFAALMRPTNVGGVWLRRQGEPRARLDEMWSSVNPDRLPYLPMRERERRIIAHLTTSGRAYGKSLAAAVGHANDGDVRDDLARLVAAGALTKSDEQHGKVIWHWYTLAVTTQVALALTLEIRRALARRMAKLAALRRDRGCKRLPVGEAAVLGDPDTKKRSLAAEERTRREVESIVAGILGPTIRVRNELRYSATVKSTRAAQRAHASAAREQILADVPAFLAGIDADEVPEAVGPPTRLDGSFQWTGAALKRKCLRLAEDLLHPDEAVQRSTAIGNLHRFSRASKVFDARYPGYCQVCGGSYETGQRVFFVSDRADRVLRASDRFGRPSRGRAHETCEKWCRTGALYGYRGHE